MIQILKGFQLVFFGGKKNTIWTHMTLKCTQKSQYVSLSQIAYGNISERRCLVQWEETNMNINVNIYSEWDSINTKHPHLVIWCDAAWWWEALWKHGKAEINDIKSGRNYWNAPVEYLKRWIYTFLGGKKSCLSDLKQTNYNFRDLFSIAWLPKILTFKPTTGDQATFWSFCLQNIAQFLIW